MGRTECPDLRGLRRKPWLDGHIFNESEMALFSECTPPCARNCLTPPTLSEMSERRFSVIYFICRRSNNPSWLGMMQRTVFCPALCHTVGSICAALSHPPHLVRHSYLFLELLAISGALRSICDVCQSVVIKRREELKGSPPDRRTYLVSFAFRDQCSIIIGSATASPT